MGFPKQEYWSGLPFPISQNLPNPENELVSLVSPALAGGFFTTSTTWEAPSNRDLHIFKGLPQEKGEVTVLRSRLGPR